MTKKIKNILTAVTLVVLVFGNVSLAFSAGDITPSLDAIKTGLSERGVKVVEYAEGRPWGNLSPDVIKMLSASGAFKSGEKLKSLNDLNNYLNSEGLSVKQNAVEVRDLILDLVATTGSLNITPDDVGQIITELQFVGERQINTVLAEVATALRNVIGGIAVIWIIVAGIQMIFASGDESKITEQKRSITYTLIGLVAIILAERIVNVIYGVPGIERGIVSLGTSGEAVPPAGALLFSNEVLGVVAYIKTIIAAVAVFMIIISGMKTVFAAGEEEKIRQQRRAVMWVVVGLILIVVNQVVIENIFVIPSATEILTGTEDIAAQNIGNIIRLFGNLTKFILGFVGIIAFASLIYSGLLMVTNIGNDETTEKAKKTIKNALIGIVIIIASFAIVNTMVVGFGAAL